LLLSLVDRTGLWQHRTAAAWARVSLWISGARVHVRHEERLKQAPIALFVSNHLSYMDTPTIFGKLPFQFRIVARQSLWKIPFIGWHLQRSGQIPVNVENPRASIASLSRGVKTLQAGMPLFIFPEGGRSRSGLLGPFMNGPAYMAIRARVPIVPIALVGTFELLPIHAKRFHPGEVLMIIGSAISTAGYTLKDVDVLTARVSESISDLYYSNTYLRPPATTNENAPLTNERLLPEAP
jgi:1-acyl-sn-glycerol-3-phosphate acyltransferase